MRQKKSNLVSPFRIIKMKLTKEGWVELGYLYQCLVHFLLNTLYVYLVFFV